MCWCVNNIALFQDNVASAGTACMGRLLAKQDVRFSTSSLSFDKAGIREIFHYCVWLCTWVVIAIVACNYC
jgi:hypothetical protein